MDKFLGKWVEIKGNLEAYKEFMESMSIPKETAEKMLTYTGFLETVKEGDGFKMTTGYKEDASLTRIYNFKLNETFSGEDNFGVKFTLFCKVEGDKWYDNCTDYYNHTIESIREVDGDIMKVKSTCNGKILDSKFKRE